MGKIIFAQIGKNGVTKNFIENLKSSFKKNKTIRISVLKSARENGKEDIKKYSDEIIKKLGEGYYIKTIGFVIIIKNLKTKSNISFKKEKSLKKVI